jgi:sugar phosphate isomerase/epimerase
MKLGFVSAIFPDLTLEEVLQFASGEKFDCVEIMSWPLGKAERKYAGVTHVDVTDFNESKARDVLDLVEKHQIQISALGYYPNILDADASSANAGKDHLKKVIEGARMLGIDRVNSFIGADPRKNPNENFEAFQGVWPEIIEFAEKHGVRIGIENCPMLFTLDEWPSGKNLAYSPALWRRMFERIPSPNFGLNYDPSHFIWQFMDYVEPLYEFKDRIFHAHAKDLKIERKLLNDQGILSLGWSTPKIPGLGDVDWNRFVSALTDIGYDGPVCIEVEDDAFRPELDKRKRSLRIARDVLRPLIQD